LFKRLTLNAPNMYSWIPYTMYTQFYVPGLIFGTSVLLLYVAMAYKSKVKFTAPILVFLAEMPVLLAPYFLPKMHERYFFASDVLSIIFAFFFPRKAYLAIILNLLSFFSYQFFIFKAEDIPQLSLMILITIIMMVWQLVFLLHPNLKHESEEPQIDQGA
jgi:Gpi18-like mannosyltransferase